MLRFSRILTILGLLSLLSGCHAARSLGPESAPGFGPVQLAFGLGQASAQPFSIQAAKQVTDVALIRFCLLEANTGVPPAGGTLLTPINYKALPGVTFTRLPGAVQA